MAVAIAIRIAICTTRIAAPDAIAVRVPIQECTKTETRARFVARLATTTDTVGGRGGSS